MTQNSKIYRIDKKNRMLENSLNCVLTIEKNQFSIYKTRYKGDI